MHPVVFFDKSVPTARIAMGIEFGKVKDIDLHGFYVVVFWEVILSPYYMDISSLIDVSEVFSHSVDQLAFCVTDVLLVADYAVQTVDQVV